ncbi:MAG: hypothetical protein ACE5GK_12415 [Nitrospiria bacterium]
MCKDLEGFLREKLSKKFLSANTIRDLIMALFLLILQKREEMTSGIPRLENWREATAMEIREKANQVFSAIDAPFEYPTRDQLIKTTGVLEKKYRFDQLPPQLRKEYEGLYQRIVSKFS